MATPARSEQPVARLLDESADVLPEYWPLEGPTLVCEVCGEPAKFVGDDWSIICRKHRRMA